MFREIIASISGKKRVELILDDCPLYDFSQAGKIPADEIETSIKVMEMLNNIEGN
ncbi:MAG: hypothetical protein PVF58_04165 [Candidatus Methanofastidiosia archaeon]|jgi:hypothetical protein